MDLKIRRKEILAMLVWGLPRLPMLSCSRCLVGFHNHTHFFGMVTHRMVDWIVVWEMRHCQWPNWAFQTENSTWALIIHGGSLYPQIHQWLSHSYPLYHWAHPCKEHQKFCHYPHIPTQRTLPAWEHPHLPPASLRWNGEGYGME